MSDNLLLGTIRIDITPDFPTFQAGYAIRKHNAEGIHDPIYLIIYFFKTGSKKLVFCSFDLCTLDEEVVCEFRKIAKNEFELNSDDLLLSATHTHQAPAISKNPIFIGDPIPYRKFVIEKYRSALKEVQQKLIPVTTHTIGGISNIGVNRRGFKPNKGILRFLGLKSPEVIKVPNPFNPWDRTTQIFFFLRKEKKSENNIQKPIPVGLIFKMTAHPTILGGENYLLSAGWPGTARNYIEKGINDNYFEINDLPRFEKNENFHPLFLQGTSGDVKPSILVEPPLFESIFDKNFRSKHTKNEFKFREGTFNDVEEMGKITAKEIIMMINSAFSSKKWEITNLVINSRLYYIEIPLKKPPNISYFKKILGNKNSDWVMKAWANRVIKIYNENGKLPTIIRWPFHFVTFGNQALLIGIGGEPVSEISFILQNIFSDCKYNIMCICGSTGEYFTYLPSKKIIKEGGYESNRVVRWTNQPSPISKSINKILKKEMKKIKKEFFKIQ